MDKKCIQPVLQVAKLMCKSKQLSSNSTKISKLFISDYLDLKQYNQRKYAIFIKLKTRYIRYNEKEYFMWPGRQVVRQGSAKPLSRVRFPPRPPKRRILWGGSQGGQGTGLKNRLCGFDSHPPHQESSLVSIDAGELFLLGGRRMPQRTK